jgi:hypothetical protein
MHWVRFESMIPVFNWAKTFYALTRAVTVIGTLLITLANSWA